MAKEPKELEIRGEYHPGGVSKNGNAEDKFTGIYCQDRSVCATFVHFQQFEAEKEGAMIREEQTGVLGRFTTSNPPESCTQGHTKDLL